MIASNQRTATTNKRTNSAGNPKQKSNPDTLYTNQDIQLTLLSAIW